MNTYWLIAEPVALLADNNRLLNDNALCIRLQLET